MKTIQPVDIWIEGQVQVADKLSVFITYDDLATTATFTYLIGYETGNPIIELKPLSSGTVVISGQQYIDWDNSNNQAYEIVATYLNLVIIPQ
jgi:hypothetical protein